MEVRQEDYSDLAAVLAEIFAKTSPSGQVQFQFFHGIVPEIPRNKLKWNDTC